MRWRQLGGGRAPKRFLLRDLTLGLNVHALGANAHLVTCTFACTLAHCIQTSSHRQLREPVSISFENAGEQRKHKLANTIRPSRLIVNRPLCWNCL